MPRRLAFFVPTVLGALMAVPVARAADDNLRALKELSVDQLLDLQVTSVAKRSTSLARASTSIYVITRDAIRRSGANTLAEALRLAPNLQVEQINSQEYQIAARGFGSHLEFQNFSNKILSSSTAAASTTRCSPAWPTTLSTSSWMTSTASR